MSIEIKDKLDFLVSYAAPNCGADDVETFNRLDTSNVTLDDTFYHKMDQIMNRIKPSSPVPKFKRVLVRIAVALMALMSLGFLTVMAAPDLREAFFDAIVQWYEDYIAIRFEQDETEAPETTVSADAPTTIEKLMKPTYLPDGVEEEIVLNGASTAMIEYYMCDDLYYIYYQKLLLEHSILFDNDTALITEVKIGDYSANLIEFKDRRDKTLVWTDGEYMYCIDIFDPSMSMDEIIKIASSVN